MLKKIENFVSYGEINEDTFKKLQETSKNKEEKVFHLHPPIGGFKSIKIPFPKGNLGYNGTKINDLLNKMLI